MGGNVTAHYIVPLYPHGMSDPKELKGTGLKVTVPRLRVLDLFQHSDTRHLTAEDVYRKLLGEHSDIGPYSAEKWLEIYAAHARDHADQIRQSRAAFKERK